MSHAALVNDVVFWLVAFLTLLLVMFIGAVIWMPLGPPPPLHRPYTHGWRRLRLHRPGGRPGGWESTTI